ncbi:hypothetical protein ON010_g18375 [Phytophthora cinnamomi]|nr:hypothetical protein ON010_g18375 [Phytophthora cinnamomi]
MAITIPLQQQQQQQPQRSGVSFLNSAPDNCDLCLQCQPALSDPPPSVSRDALGLEPEPEGVAVLRAVDHAVVVLVRALLHRAHQSE